MEEQRAHTHTHTHHTHTHTHTQEVVLINYFYAKILPLLVCVNKTYENKQLVFTESLSNVQYIFPNNDNFKTFSVFVCIIYDIEQIIVNLYLPQAIEILLLNYPILINSGRTVKQIPGGGVGVFSGGGGGGLVGFVEVPVANFTQG